MLLIVMQNPVQSNVFWESLILRPRTDLDGRHKDATPACPTNTNCHSFETRIIAPAHTKVEDC